MLDSETKRRIDSARDILVGKVPDPKSQVEQITIALIYKFMDDMDSEGEEFGGKRKFFANDFARYGWSQLMRSGLGGHETLNLYAEAIAKMPENPGIPPLFRDIFKNAYLPYRDPETLRSFLKIIDEFNYDHSERLGDAFEYLLSVLGSQGDAGQFRTPRHIIDFIVSIIDPKKNESVLDPACGTAGFLISSYKHILRANSDADNNSTLTPDEKGRLAQNFKGYDISPDMVRLSLVNMYLHGFAAPHIYEYDTLTSQDRWNEHADVILANPPFMSPKGGIRPHNRFSVQSKRSEVLFVDYMAEHLTPNGRAGIIVPEGIIFQSQNAHKQLRKMLVEDYLVAVISLPSGVFNPYSGVKTSILILDKALAKKSSTIAFFKIEADGFDLGAQRREIGQNDLPKAMDEVNEYLSRLRLGKSVDNFESKLGLVVEKDKVAANGDYNLIIERYRTVDQYSGTYPVFTISELCELGRGRVISKEYIEGNAGEYPVYSSQTQNDGIFGFINSFDFEGEYVTWTTDGANAGTVFYRKGKFNCTNVCGTLKSKFDSIDMRYLAHALANNAKKHVIELGNPKLMNNVVAKIQIPLPPLEVQKEIVAEIEGYHKVIDGARAVIDNYRPHIPVDPDWPVVKLDEVGEVTSSKRILAEEYVSSGIPFYRTKEIVELSKGYEISLELFISTERYESIRTRFGAPTRGDLLVSAVGTIGVSWVVCDDREFYFKDGNLLWIRNLSNLDPYFLKYCLDSIIALGLDHIVFGAAYKALTIEKLKEFKIPLPPLSTQQAIVAEIEAEQALVEANRELVTRFEQKIQAALARVWGD